MDIEFIRALENQYTNSIMNNLLKNSERNRELVRKMNEVERLNSLTFVGELELPKCP